MSHHRTWCEPLERRQLLSGGDFSLDFVAAAPFTYNHATGGGAFDDRTIGKTADVVESLEGGDFACGDIVTYLVAIKVGSSAVGAQSIDLDFEFLSDATGQSGVGHDDIVGVKINYGAIAKVDVDGNGTLDKIGDGPANTDSGNKDDGGSVATLISETLPSNPFHKGTTNLKGTVRITDLEKNEQVILRVDVHIDCDDNASPTGNLQAAITSAKVSAPVVDTIQVGQQTVPFKNIDELITPGIDLDKTGPSVSKIGDSVTYTYTVTNTGNVSLQNVVIKDDAGTPGNTADDFQLTTPSSGDANTNSILEETEVWTFSKTLTVPAGATDPFVNTARVDATAAGSALTTSDTDTHSIDLFKPGVTVTKAIVGAPTSALIGDTITYRITITNTSDGDLTTVALDNPNNNTPDLEVATITDALLDAVLPSGGKVKDLAIAAGLGTLDFGESGSFDVSYTITAANFPTLTNTVAVLYHPAGFPNDVKDDDSVSLSVDIPHVPGRMTGGGSIFTTSAANIGAGVRITHGFQLHCTIDANNRLEVNWGKPNQHFHLSNLTEVACMDHPFIIQAPPDAPIDTLIGKGLGGYSGTYKGKKYSKAAAEITFIFIDAGEPGGSQGTAPHDSASYIIKVLNGPGAADDVVVLNTGDNNGVRDANDLLLANTGQIDLTFGNHQAHDEIKRLLDGEAAQLQRQIDQTLAALDNVSLTEDRILSLTSQLNSLFDQLEAAIKASA